MLPPKQWCLNWVMHADKAKGGCLLLAPFQFAGDESQEV
jgi:hypothetical protein